MRCRGLILVLLVACAAPKVPTHATFPVHAERDRVSRSHPRPRAFVPSPQAKSVRRPDHRGDFWNVTRASWYAERPTACYDSRGRHPFPRSLTLWTAHKTLPCGTVITVRFGNRTIRVAVLDRGPYVAGRDLDLSRAAFAYFASPDIVGVLFVRWRVAS